MSEAAPITTGEAPQGSATPAPRAAMRGDLTQGPILRTMLMFVAPLVIIGVALYPARLGFYYFAYPRIGGEAVWWPSPVGGLVSLVLTWGYYALGPWRESFKG